MASPSKLRVRHERSVSDLSNISSASSNNSAKTCTAMHEHLRLTAEVEGRDTSNAWACPPEASVASRRPSLQEDDSLDNGPIIQNPFEQAAGRYHHPYAPAPHLLQPQYAAVHRNAAQPVMFVSPFAAQTPPDAIQARPAWADLVPSSPSSSTLAVPRYVHDHAGSIGYSQKLQQKRPSASSESDGPWSFTTGSSQSGTPFSPSTVSSPGVHTPYSELASLTPFEAAFRQQIRLSSPSDSSLAQPFAGTSLGPAVAAEQDDTLSPLSPFPPSSKTGVQVCRPGHPSPLSPSFPRVSRSPLRPAADAKQALSTDQARQLRRKSVDVGVLVNARGQQHRSARAAGRESSATTLTALEQQNRTQRAHRPSSQRNREHLFAQHLTSILAHSLSLCSAGGVASAPSLCSSKGVDEHEGGGIDSSPDSSPRSSISDSSSTSAGRPADTGPSFGAEHASLLRRLRTQRLPSFSSVSSIRRLELINLLSIWSFDANDLDQDELCECANIMFECLLQMDGIDSSITIDRIKPLLLSLRSAYHARNAYHNFAHAVDVTQACYSFLTTLKLAPPLSTLTDPECDGTWTRDPSINAHGRLGDVMQPMHVLALMIAALGHDVGHPGLSNAYMVNARTAAAQVYNDKSVLENFHSVTLARMLKMHGLGHLLETESGSTEFRQVLLASVLATDMSRHFPFVGKLTELGARYRASGYRSDAVPEDRLLICSGLMKCADISNPTRPHKVARQWSTALLEEWAVQAQIEAKFKLPISVVILNPEEQVAQAKSQVGFINLFTQPLFDAMASVAPDFSVFADCCREGRAVWEMVLNADVTPPSTGANHSPQATPTMSSLSSFTPCGVASRRASSEDESSDRLPMPSRGFSSRLPPHRAPPRPLQQIEIGRANAGAAGSPLPSASSVSSFGTSPPRSLVFDRSASISSTASAASWIPPTTVDDCLPLGNEECMGNCSDVTALCISCSQKAYLEGLKAAEPTSTYYGSPIDEGIWPPDPFRPRPPSRTSRPLVA